MAKTDLDNLRIGAHVAWREVGEEIVVLDLSTSVYYSLKDVAASIWRLLAAKKSAPDIVAALTKEYAVTEAVARRDVDKFLSGLVKERIASPAS